MHTYHGHVFHSYFSPRRTATYLHIERKLARWTDRLIVLSEQQEREILGFGVGRPEQMVRIPLGLELEPFLHAAAHRGALRASLGIGAATPLVGIVARLVPIKAHALFLQAARRVALCRPDVRFVIVGDGELRERLELHALEQGLTVCSHRRGRDPELRGPASGIGPVPTVVHFLGFRSDLVNVYADLDVVVLCSKNEGLPVTIIEALAAARPVVATDVGAVRDLVVPGETGLLVDLQLKPGTFDPVDPGKFARDLADAVNTVARDESLRERFGRNGRRRVEEHFSWTAIAHRTLDLYRSLVERGTER